MAHCRQEMPPPGGYEPVTWCRIPTKPGWSNLTRYGLIFGVCTAGLLIYKHTINQLTLEKIEMRCGRIALQPLILAESDRLLLKQLKKNRDEEEKLMKNVPGWEVGKWQKYPVYLTVGSDEFFLPNRHEYFAHAPSSFISSIFEYKAN